MSDFFDFLTEESGDQTYDLVLVINNPNITDWINTLNFMKIDYLIISPEKKNSEISNKIVYSKADTTSDKFWTYVFNNYKSHNYAIIGKNDTPENFDLFYLDYFKKGALISINNSEKYMKFNTDFNLENEHLDCAGCNYIMFKWNYLKFVLKNTNDMDFKHRLVYYKNLYKNEIKSTVVEFLGVNTKISARDKFILFKTKLRHRRLLPLSIMIALVESLLVLLNDTDFFIRINLIVIPFALVLVAVDALTKEAY